MYNSKFMITYNYYDPALGKFDTKFDPEDVADLEDVVEVLFRAELLQIFNLTEYDDAVIRVVIHELYDKLKTHAAFNECINLSKIQYDAEEHDIGFVLLFSYNHLYITHLCIRDFLDTGIINNTHIDLLMESLRKIKK